MSRNRREKNPGAKCSFDWPSMDAKCPHVCQLDLDHVSDHFCCPSSDGSAQLGEGDDAWILKSEN